MYASNISRIRNWRELGTERTRRKDLTFHCLSSKFFEFSFFYYNHVIQTIFYKYICMCIYIFLCTYTHIPWASFHDTVCNTISIFHLLHSIPVPGAVHLLGRYCIKCWGVMRKGADRRAPNRKCRSTGAAKWSTSRSTRTCSQRCERPHRESSMQRVRYRQCPMGARVKGVCQGA